MGDRADDIHCLFNPKKYAYDTRFVNRTNVCALAAFDPQLETIVSADASLYGLGAVLVQKQRDGTSKPVVNLS